MSESSTHPVAVESDGGLRELLAAEPVVLLEVYTPGCGICASMEPVLGTVARATDATVALVDATDAPEFTAEHDVVRAPTLFVFVDGAPVARRDEGFVGAEELLDWLAAHR
jgi:thioredoxin 1